MPPLSKQKKYIKDISKNQKNNKKQQQKIINLIEEIDPILLPEIYKTLFNISYKSQHLITTQQKLVNMIDKMSNHEKSKVIKLLNTMRYSKEKNKDIIISTHLQNKAMDFIKE
ncbi:5308_t:CDS:1, partial [Racocetra fulgida]